MKHNIFIIILLIMAAKAGSQSLGEQLNNRLKNKKNYNEIMRIIDSIYAASPADIRENGGDGLPKYKHWWRWSWYMKRRLDENGNLVDITKRKLELVEQLRRERTKNKSARSSLPGSWEPIGCDTSGYSPNASNSFANGTGRFDRIAFHPTDASTFYIGAPFGGLWKTTDGGETWKCLTDTIPSIGVSGIVVSYNNANTVYILTGQGDGPNNLGSNFCQGVMKSTDAGATWAFVGSFPVTSGFTNLVGFNLVQNPTNANILLPVTNDGIFRTTNGGTSWTKTRDGLHYDIAFKPGSGNDVVAATDDSLFYSTNGGVAWTGSTRNIAPSPTSIRISLAFSPSEPNKVYAFHGNNGVLGQFSGVYRSDDSGVNFTRLANTPNVLGYELAGNDAGSQASYDLCMTVHPDSTSRVIIGSVNIWRSADSGTTFTNNTGWKEDQGAIAYVHCDHHALAYNPLNNKLYSCNDGGIWESANSGNTWKDISKGLQANMFYNLSQYNNNTTYILAGGTQDNGTKYRSAGTKNFTHMWGADGSCVAFQANNPNIFYANANALVARFDYTTGAGVIVTPQPSGGKFLITHPVDTSRVFAGTTTNIYHSIDKGSTWFSFAAGGDEAMALSSIAPYRLFAASNNIIWRSDSPYSTLTSSNAGLPSGNFTFTDIAPDPYAVTDVYLTVGGLINGQKVFRSTDGGATWFNITANLPNVVVNSIAVTLNKIYIGTDITVYAKDWAGNTWVDIGDNLPHSPVIDIMVDESKGIITLGTWGRGVWQRNYCVNDITLQDSLKGKLAYESNNQITASALVPGVNDFDSIFMTSGKVLLQPGFRAKEGTHMKAMTGGCDHGPQPLTRQRNNNQAALKEDDDDRKE